MDIDKNLAGYLALVNVNDVLRAPAARPLMGKKRRLKCFPDFKTKYPYQKFCGLYLLATIWMT